MAEEEDVVPDWLKDLAVKDATIDAVIELARVSKWSREDLLRAVVVELAKAKASILDDYTKHLMKPQPLVFKL